MNEYGKNSYTVKTKRPFWGMHTCFGHETQTGVVRILVIFQHRSMFSHKKKNSRRDLLNDVTEHRPIVKNN